MLREIFYELYSYHRQLVGDGAVSVLFPAALLMLALAGIRWAPFILSPLGAIAAAVSETLGGIFAKKDGRKHCRILTGIFAACLLALAIISSGGDLIFGDMVSRSSNNMHIPGDLEGAVSVILDDCEKPRVLTMPGWGVFFKSYSSAFEMMYDDPKGDDAAFDDKDKYLVYTELCTIHPDMKKVAAAAKRAGCGYVVLSNDIWPEIPITSFGYEELEKGDMFTVYREVASP